jgi:hypothetical protein
MENEEKTFEVQKNYSEEIIAEIQRAIDENTASIKILSSIEELPKIIYMDGIKMHFVHNNRYDVNAFFDMYHDKETSAKWKTESVYAFYVKDWKRLNKNINIFENNNYLEVSFKVKDADIIVLIRRVDIELANESFELMEYGDIIYNNAKYTIIKAFVPNIGESYGIKSILENNNFVDKLYLYDNNGCEILISADGSRINTSDEDGIEIVSLEDVPDPESEELF